jgi:hypothetical protein
MLLYFQILPLTFFGTFDTVQMAKQVYYRSVLRGRTMYGFTCSPQFCRLNP